MITAEVRKTRATQALYSLDDNALLLTNPSELKMLREPRMSCVSNFRNVRYARGSCSNFKDADSPSSDVGWPTTSSLSL